MLDRGGSRASLIPLLRNHAGFSDGIAGVHLVDRTNRQAELCGALHGAGVERLAGDHGEAPSSAANSAASAVRIVDSASPRFALVNDGLEAATSEGTLSFDSVYPVLGSVAHADLHRRSARAPKGRLHPR